MRRVAIDSETYPIGIEHGPLPPPVCWSFAWRDEAGAVQSWLFGDGDPEAVPFLARLLADPEAELWFVNAAFDLGVLAVHHPALRPVVFDAYAQGRVRDASVEEMLRAVSTAGRIGQRVDPETGETERVRYSLAALAERYIGVDRSADKAGGVRLRYGELAGRRAAEYPPEFRRYALQDAEDTLRIGEAQVQTSGSVATRELHVAADFALKLMTHEGLDVDAAEVARLATRIEDEMTDERHPLLVATGILEPARGPRPHANGAQDHRAGCDRAGCGCAWIQPKRRGGRAVGWQRKHVRGCPRPRCDCPPALVPAEPAHVRQEPLHARVLEIAARAGLEVELTEKGQEALEREALLPAQWAADPRLRDPKSARPLYVGCSGTGLNELAVHDEVLREYRHRKRLEKLDQSLAAARCGLDAGYPRVHPNYHPLKETGRTSSYGSRQTVVLGEKGNLYPSQNVQQVPNPPKVKVEGLEFLDDLDVRRQFTPGPGRVFALVDAGSLELTTFAQATYSLFGESRHREVLNSGRDCHSYLGAQILERFGRADDPEVQRFLARVDVRRASRLGDRVALHDAFRALRDGYDGERRVFKEYRTTAKPVGLGYPGMLGPRKLAYKIFPQYNLDATEEQARGFQEVWLDSYPEAARWRQYVAAALRDPTVAGAYAYTSRLGFVRRACSFCAAANGLGMQTPGAEAMKVALFEVARAAYDPRAGSILFARFVPRLFVHDEVGGTTADDWTAHHVAEELGAIMRRAMRAACPDVEPAAEPLLSRAWCKAAEPVRRDGLLVPWEPSAPR